MVNSFRTFIRSLLSVKPPQQSQSNSHSCLSFSVATDLLSFAIKLVLLSSSEPAPTSLWRTTRKTVLLAHQQHLCKRLFGGWSWEDLCRENPQIQPAKHLLTGTPTQTSGRVQRGYMRLTFEQNEHTPTLKSLVWGEWWTGTPHCGHFGGFWLKNYMLKLKKKSNQNLLNEK